jgi:hypothetical protein
MGQNPPQFVTRGQDINGKEFHKIGNTVDVGPFLSFLVREDDPNVASPCENATSISSDRASSLKF